ncbi:hypothetical protein [Actinosynnema pretiosum]|uniref:Helix-turn-helix domain-containing protein n=1 Tax=Actinosynnema pretiosum TaxID=42197 RepID=A0A290ZDS1_9PSEU|nr:hypothetical protein [Actinosynnema pretiosum]ATE57129.1 hypothetical protein CNX65_30735 [Actinosynnema pretiosum]
MTVADAAARLGVTPERVREVAATGRLEVLRLGPRSTLVSAESVARRVAGAPGAGRPLSAQGAWSVLLLASGITPPWAVPTRYRGFARRPLREWPKLMARRSRVCRVRVLGAVRERLVGRPDVVVGGAAAADRHGLGLVVPGDDPVELYLPPEVEAELRGRRGIGWDSPNPNVVLRVLPPLSWGALFADGVVPKAVAAADLLDLGDDRSRRVAAELLGRDR